METVASYILIGACAMLVLFSIILVIAMLSYDEKAGKTAKRLEKHAVHLQIIDKIQDDQSARINSLHKRVQSLEEKSTPKAATPVRRQELPSRYRRTA